MQYVNSERFWFCGNRANFIFRRNLNTSFVHAADGIQYVRDDTRDKEEGIEYDDADNGDIIVKVATKPKVVTKKISSTRIRYEKMKQKTVVKILLQLMERMAM